MLLPWLAGFGLAGLIVITPAMFPFTLAVLISDVSDLIQLADIGGEPLLLGLLMTGNVAVATALNHRKALLAPAAIAMLLAVGLAPSYAHWGASAQWANGAAATNAQSSVRALVMPKPPLTTTNSYKCICPHRHSIQQRRNRTNRSFPRPSVWSP